MRKIIFAIVMATCCAGMASARKFALVDMDYILRNVPAYEMANEQLNRDFPTLGERGQPTVAGG